MSSFQELFTFLSKVEYTECIISMCFLKNLIILQESLIKSSDEVFDINYFENIFYNSPKFTNIFFSNMFFMAKKELICNINRYINCLSVNIKHSLKKIIIINISKIYDILYINLFDKKVEIISKRMGQERCDENKGVFRNMIKMNIEDREIYCHEINQKNKIRNLEQVDLEIIITTNIDQEETSKKRKNDENVNTSLIKKITISVFKENVNKKMV
jgi:hypothetical protein